MPNRHERTITQPSARLFPMPQEQFTIARVGIVREIA